MARLCTHTESGHYLMALDAGTGSVRAVIFDLQGKQIAVGQAEMAASGRAGCAWFDGV